MNIVRRCMVFILAAVLLAAPVTPAGAIDQDVTDVYTTAEPSPRQIVQEEARASVLDRFQFRGFVDLQQGYDNNVDLDPSRHKDGFLQTTANGEVVYNATEAIDLKAGSDLFSMVYYTYNENNLLDVSPYIGIDIDITPDIVWKNKFTFDYFSYPNDKESTFSGIKFSSFLRQYFMKDVYHEIGAEVLKRWFPDRKVAMANAELGNKDREDGRFRLQYNIGGFFYDAFIRVSNEYSRNNSNYSFQDFYDFQSYRLRPSVMYFFTDQLYADIALLYRYVDYKDRRNTEDIDQTVSNHNFTFISSAYYDITRNVTLGVTYSYNENVSNDPFEEYSGSVVSGGVFVSF